MKFSFPCPQSVRQNLSTDDANNSPATGIKIEIDGALLSFEFDFATHDERLESVDELDAWLGLAVADEDRPEMIRALSDLKAAVASLRDNLVRESLYTEKRSGRAALLLAEAIPDDVESHLHAEQHASSEGSSEQQGAAPQDEENENGTTHEKEQQQPAGRRGRKRG